MNEHDRLISFLSNPASYPHRPAAIDFARTHASIVAIAPPFVYKIKKPVNFGFLDFSTLEKRKYFCEREVELNRRLSPDVYLGVVPISAAGGRLAFGSDGEAVEYAVKMKLLSKDGFFDQKVERGEASSKDIERIVETLRVFYIAQHPTDEIEVWGRVDRLKVSTDENFEQARRFIGQTITKPAFEALRWFADEFYAKRRAVFDSRLAGKWIRDCHGDLHLEHIHLSPDCVRIYDCIEFNDRFRYVDVASDAAFLAMDLDYRGRPDLGRQFAEKMAAALEDRGMAGLMDFYKCYRAYVRGKVESFQSADSDASPAGRKASAGRASRYFRLALNYITAGSHPMILAVMGRIASGKSTLACHLSAELGWKTISSDLVRKELARIPAFERGGAEVRRELYSREMTGRTYATLLDRAASEIEAGRSVIIDATFGDPEQRAQARARFRCLSADYCFAEIQTGDDITIQRLRARETKTDEASDARIEDLEALSAAYYRPSELGPREWLAIDGSQECDAMALDALKALASRAIDPAT